jgi:tetratricopeptide (TPR) repeat protein
MPLRAVIDRRWQCKFATMATLAFVLAALPYCRRSPTPQEALEHARNTFLHGDLLATQEEAERGYQQFLGSSPEWALRFRILEAESLAWRGLSQQVLGLLDALPVSTAQASAIPILTLKGLAHARLHDFSDADLELQEAEKLCVSASDATCGGVLRARGFLAMEQGRFLVARSYFSQSLTFARARGDQFLEATALLNLGTASLKQGRFDEAIDWSESARRLSVSLGAGYIAQVVLGNLGWAYYKLGDSERALDSFLQAEKRASQVGATQSQVVWLTTAGYVYLDRHEYSTAEGSYLRALDLAQKIDSKEDIVNALMSLALVSEQMGKLEEADQYADRTISMARADGNRLDELYPLLVKGQVAARLHDPAQAEHSFVEVARDPKSDVSLKWEAEHQLARLYESQNQVDSAAREYRAALNTFETARSSLQHEESELPFLTNASRMYDDYVHFLVAQGKSTEALQVADFTRARTLAEGLGLLRKAQVPSALNPQTVARRAGGAILFYWLGEKQSYLWAITAQTTTLCPLPPGSEIDAAVERYKRALAGPQDVLETSNPNGIGLYQMLIAPAQAALGKNGKVLIIPDGSLNQLNFETLLVQTPRLHYWIEDATVSSASSLRLLRANQSPTHSSSGNLLLVGNPLAAGQDYGELPNAAVEMENIEKHFAPAARTISP